MRCFQLEPSTRSYRIETGCSAAPVGQRQRGRTGGHPGAVPAEVDLDAAVGEVAVGEQRR